MTEDMTIFDALPGQLMDVSEVTHSLTQMWAGTVNPDQEAPSEFRASQMNIVLHFGLKTSPDEAFDRFNTAIAFAQRYPCRIVVLCPMGRESSDRLLQGKLFAQCYVGSSMRDMCCCEALMLGYPTREAGFLANQVSIWLENDLPTYHWFNRIPAERITGMHLDFVKRCRRVIYDSDIEEADILKVKWPRPEAAVDLAHARILPIRQSLGQFLSRYETAKLAGGLQGVQVRYTDGREGEARNLLKWTESCLQACAKDAKLDLNTEFTQHKSECSNCLEIEWTYDDSRHFLWTHENKGLDARVTADFGSGRVSTPMQVGFLEPVNALAEALFFN
ncbi:glucose-6-phosphate dehydrogenase assembly protein OpcA [Ruficoccus sp. ZRK36]|uniref:glucose-6-phosphate dehydrogenase assembly protein OpcA n=1 Tax=Ruficoccus sp. ZRK36 TaxID=2866311 RepID=UPI001C7357D2|nr:glucose-6-phosphate dehydrogenase assembly protein OpcA [Ruficoccus sp. ZRK36]QYY36208.1 glucose-6-phosphate dehydrogenase assembly protein OpcA [Ruficoccus sp. ZRK36]